MELQSLYDCVFLRGNHDELCYEWLKGKKDNPMWHKHGGLATMASYKGVGRNTKKRHMEFYKTLLNYYLDGQRRLFLHAGFTNLKGVEHEYFGKTFYWDRTLWELALAVDPKLKTDDALYPQRLKNYKEIFIGHTPVTRMGHTTPQQAASVWNIDTGAAFKGPLTALDVQTKEYVQTEPVYTFYPDEPAETKNGKGYVLPSLGNSRNLIKRAT